MPPESASTSILARSVSRNRSSRSSPLARAASAAHPEEAAVEVEVLPHVERPVERVGLGHHADQPLGLAGCFQTSTPPDEGPTLGGQRPVGEHAGGRGLAGAVGPQQPEDLAAAHHEVQLVDGFDAAWVHLGQVHGADDLVLVKTGRDGAVRCGWRFPVHGDGGDDVEVFLEPLPGEGALGHDGEPFVHGAFDRGSHELSADATTFQALRHAGVDEDESVAVEAVGQLGERTLGLVEEATARRIVDHRGRGRSHCW